MTASYSATVQALRDPTPSRRRRTIVNIEQEWSDDAISSFAMWVKEQPVDTIMGVTSVLSYAKHKALLNLLCDIAENENPLISQRALDAFERVANEDRIPQLEKLVSSKNIPTREAAVKLLGKSQSSAPRSVLVKALCDNAPSVVCLSLQALGALNCTDAIGDIVSSLKNKSHNVRCEAIDVISKICPKNEYPSLKLIDRLQNDDDNSVRSTAAYALSYYALEKHYAPLCYALEHDIDQAVRVACAEGLPAFKKNDESVLSLIKASAVDSSNQVSLVCMRSLSEIDDSLILDACKTLLCDGISSVRVAAATALGNVNSNESLQVLLGQLNKEEDDAVASAIIGAIGRGEWIEAWADIQNQIDAQEPLRSFSAINALADMLDEAHINDFIGLLDIIKIPTFHESIIKRLGRYGRSKKLPPELLARLEAELNSENRNIRVLAAETLGIMKTPSAIKALLIGCVKNEDPSFRESASSSITALLVYIENSDLFNWLEALSEKQMCAMSLVWGYSLPENIYPIIDALAHLALKTSDAKAALYALGSASPNSIATVLHRGCSDEIKSVLLGIWGVLPAVEQKTFNLSLDAFLTHPMENVRRSALDSINALSDDKLIPILVDMSIEDESAGIRENAMSAIKRVIESGK